VPRLRMRGAIPPLHQYVFTAWCLIKQWMCLHSMVLSYAQGQLYLTLPCFMKATQHYPPRCCHFIQIRQATYQRTDLCVPL